MNSGLPGGTSRRFLQVTLKVLDGESHPSEVELGETQQSEQLYASGAFEAWRRLRGIV
jgi:hypothetical protein